MKRPIAVFGLALVSLCAVRAENAVKPGRIVIEPPTLICLGFEWPIAGDDNRNATVAVSYRASGSMPWHEALPLLRMGGERTFRSNTDYTVPEGFAGSVLDLTPDTEYEVRLTMKDPDGVTGNAVETVKVRTRGEPKAAAGGRIKHVYPPNWKGPKQEPAFTGLMAAYYEGSGLGDWNEVWENKAKPGDIIVVHAGLYKADRMNYVDVLGTPFDGTYVLTAKGTPDKPIVIRAAGDGEVIFDGDGCFRLFDVMAADYNMFEGITIRNTDIAFYAGLRDVLGPKGLTVKHCRIENVGIGINAQYAGSKDFYIADNVFLGRLDQHRLIGWANPDPYGPHPLSSYYAVKVYGSGHVICHNYVAYFHDGIDVSTHGMPDPGSDKAVAIDIYNNDIHATGDDFIEADGGVYNIRVMRNRGINSAQCALSAQPVFGGPAYFIRNVVYHNPAGPAFKWGRPAGVIAYHNTIIAENYRMLNAASNVHFRNNLFLGTDAPGKGIQGMADATSYSTYDYDGYRPNRGVAAQYLWIAPSNGKVLDYDLTPRQSKQFRTLAELSAASGQEKHGVELDYDIFEDLRPPDPSNPHAIYFAKDLNFKLKPGSKAVDKGVRLPNVNDDFTGQAPDLGAYEVGQPVPVYGPRD